MQRTFKVHDHGRVEIFNTIRNGRSGTVMSGFAGDLSEEETWTIITWLRDENRKRKAP